jgi:hypothetical protein
VHRADFKLSLTDQHLVDLGQTLLALMPLELSPEFQMLIQTGESLTVIFGQHDLFPKLGGQVGAFDRLHIKIDLSLIFTHGCIPCISQGATVTGAQASQVVLVAAEGLNWGSKNLDYNLIIYLALKEQ